MKYIILHTKAANCEPVPDGCWCDSDKLLSVEPPEIIEFAYVYEILNWMQRVSKCKWIVDLDPAEYTIEMVERLLGRKLNKDEILIEVKEYNWWIE